MIPNERLLATVARQTSLLDAFRSADDVLLQAVRGISDLVTVHGLINLDFADVRTIMSEMGMAIMGCGIARGESRAVEAAQQRHLQPAARGHVIRGARGVLINITGSADLALHEINDASSLIQEEAHEDANIIFGAVIDESMGDELRITVIATGFGMASAAVEPEPVVVPMPSIIGSRPVAHAAARSFGPESIRRVGATDRPVRRVGRVVDEGGEPHIQACENDTSVPDAPSEFTIDPISDDDAEHDYESPAFLRRAK